MKEAKINFIEKRINNNLDIKIKKKNIFNNKKQNNKKEMKRILKPSLKCSKINIEQKKNIIKKIIEENLRIDKIKFIQAKNDLFLNNSLLEAQSSYEIEIENLFKEKMEKLNEINEKYNDDIFELKNDIEQDKNNSKEENESEKDKIINKYNDNNGVEIVYNRLIEDKNKEIKSLDKEYENKYNDLYKKYIEHFEFEDLEERNMIYRNQIYESIKTKIIDIINPINNKNVKFKIDSEVNSKNTSSTEITI